MTINSRVRQAVAVNAIVFATAACTATVAGTPLPASGASATPTANLFATLNACQVLDRLNAGQGYAPGENKTRRNECTATKPGAATDSLALDPVQGLNEFAQRNAAAVQTSINGRPAMQADMPLGGCAVAVEVGEHARALVLMTLATGPDDPQACVDAKALAERLEPLLP
ncbi:DUF3558 domain-containing protein [Amycolatopsis viridis]|uniref:DUF3558 domain-containing protein n=1 Tax=Amycolatopsis viridis TaxID=185678 RepID=A0ABX0T162_9PSEU|nr:DUF3558 domain-containing protein [Amycolatopsis viridis]NIH81629.1 hypothetical protein [Amycolatopsis viridis]